MEIAVGSELGITQDKQHTRDACCFEVLAPNVALLAVADGFGRLGCGCVAEIAVTMLQVFLRRRMRSHALSSRSRASLALCRLMVSAFSYANSRIYAQSGSHDDYVSCGASLTAALVVGSQVYIGHVGETRAYLRRDERIAPLTDDDAIAPEIGGGGKMTIGARARVRTVLTRTLGTQASLKATVTHLELREEDRLILCTDGVYKMLSGEELEFAAGAPGTAADVVDRILELLKLRGNEDGATVIVLRELVPVTPTAENTGARRTPSRAIGVAIVVLALVVVAALLYEVLLAVHIAFR